MNILLLLAFPLGFFLYSINCLIVLTCTVRVEDRGKVVDMKWGKRFKRQLFQHEPKLFACWHQMTFVPIHTFGMNRIHVFVSENFKGYVLYWWIKLQGHIGIFLDPFDASSQATLLMIRALKKGYSVMVTPDGPTGPYHAWNPGVDYLSKKSRLPVTRSEVDMHGLRFKLFWRWDRYLIPLPFSRVTIKLFS